MKHMFFLGTPKIAADLLENLHARGIVFDGVITKPDAVRGRQKKAQPSAVKQRAEMLGLPVYTPEKIREFPELFGMPCDLIITCAYGQILPEDVLNYPTYGCINVHGSLLPAYRGAAPVQRGIWNRDPQGGVSLMKMEKGLDTGPVMVQQAFDLGELNTAEAFTRISEISADLLQKHLPEILEGKASFVPQQESEATYASPIRKDEEQLDLNQPDEKVLGQILALAPAPGAYIKLNGKKLKILRASYVPCDFGREPGTFEILSRKKAVLYLHHGCLELQKVQLEGKKAVDIGAFINGAGRAFDQAVAEV